MKFLQLSSLINNGLSILINAWTNCACITAIHNKVLYTRFAIVKYTNSCNKRLTPIAITFRHISLN